MNNKKGSVLPFLIVLLIISFFLAGAVYYLFQKEHSLNLKLQAELENVTTQYKKAESEAEASKKKVSTLGLQLKESQDRIEALNGQLQQEKTAKLEALNTLEQLKQDLEQQKQQRLDLENKLTQAQADTKKADEELNALKSRKTELEAKIKDLEAKSEGVELGKIVVGQEDPRAGMQEVTPEEAATQSQNPLANNPATGKEGKVLVVNKDYDFAVINLGSKDGVKIGDTFSVYHNTNYTGDIKVEKIHDSMAAAGFVSEGINDKIYENDKVVQKVK
jgi:vacuolar-type H+-ATPase subunit I/STV1